MSRQREREEFIGSMIHEGVPVNVARLVLRHAASLHRIAELECSSEAADRDRVRCPATKTGKDADCICDFGWGRDKSGCRTIKPETCPCHTANKPYECVTCGCKPGHATVPRISVRAQQLQRRVEVLLKPYNVEPIFQRDPRGAAVKLKVPSGRTDDWGQSGVCVP